MIESFLFKLSVNNQEISLVAIKWEIQVQASFVDWELFYNRKPHSLGIKRSSRYLRRVNKL